MNQRKDASYGISASLKPDFLSSRESDSSGNGREYTRHKSHFSVSGMRAAMPSMCQLSRSHNMPTTLEGYEMHLRKIHCEGYLDRQSKTGTWRRRWFLLKDGALSYFKDKQNALMYLHASLECDSEADNAHSRQVIPLDMIEAVRTAQHLGPNAFMVVSSDREDLILRADSKDEMQSWLIGFHSILASIITRLLQGLPKIEESYQCSSLYLDPAFQDQGSESLRLQSPHLAPQSDGGSIGGPNRDYGESHSYHGGIGKVLGHGHGREKRRSMGSKPGSDLNIPPLIPPFRSLGKSPKTGSFSGIVASKLTGEDPFRFRAQTDTHSPKNEIYAKSPGGGSWRPPLAARSHTTGHDSEVSNRSQKWDQMVKLSGAHVASTKEAYVQISESDSSDDELSVCHVCTSDYGGYYFDQSNENEGLHFEKRSMVVTAPLDVPLSLLLLNSGINSGGGEVYSGYRETYPYSVSPISLPMTPSSLPRGSCGSFSQGDMFDMSIEGTSAAYDWPSEVALPPLSPSRAASIANLLGLISPAHKASREKSVLPWTADNCESNSFHYEGDYHYMLPCRPEHTCNRGSGGNKSSSDGLWWTSGVYSIIGRREKQEDRYCVIPEFEKIMEGHNSSESVAFYGVYDGHCGFEAAQFLSEELHEMIAKSADVLETDPTKVIRDTFVEADEKFLELCEEHKLYCGSTALVVMIYGRRILVGNLGDCEAVLCRGGVALAISEKHKPDRPDEMDRIIAANGWVTTEKELFLQQLKQMDLQDPIIRSMASEQVKWTTITRTCGDLSISRAVGDIDFKGYTKRRLKTGAEGVAPENPYLFGWPTDHSGEFFDDLIIAEPECRIETIRDKDRFILMACDGLWDVMGHSDAVKHTSELLDRGLCAQAASQQLCELALRLGTSDNVTVIIVVLHHHKAPEFMASPYRCCSGS